MKIDSLRLQQILINLITNAVKFSKQDSEVIIELIYLGKSHESGYNI